MIILINNNARIIQNNNNDEVELQNKQLQYYYPDSSSYKRSFSKASYLYVAKYISRSQGYMHISGENEQFIRKQLRALAKLYQQKQVQQEFHLVCMYEGIIESEDIQKRVIQFDVLTQIEPAIKITGCKIVGIKKKCVGLQQFINQYRAKVQKRRKEGDIHKNSTVQFEKRAYEKKYGSIKEKRDNSKSSISCQDQNQPKLIPKPLQKKLEVQRAGRKRNLISGSEQQSIGKEEDQDRPSSKSGSLQVPAEKEGRGQKSKRNKSTKVRGDKKKGEKGKKGGLNRLQEIKETQKMLQLSKNNKQNNDGEGKQLPESECRVDKIQQQKQDNKQAKIRQEQKIKNEYLQLQLKDQLDKKQKKTNLVLEKIRRKDQLINIEEKARDLKAAIQSDVVHQANSVSQNNSIINQDSSTNLQRSDHSRVGHLKKGKKHQAPPNNRRLDQFFKKN